ncbi:hypothetical protein GBAR_LOCUS12004, partial [Geodia barretti]
MVKSSICISLVLVLGLCKLPVAKSQREGLSDEIVVQFGDIDLNAIKSYNICSSDSNGTDCFLSILPQTIYDVVGLSINMTQCLAIEQFEPDKNPPELIQFDMFDLNTGTLFLSFNETIRTSSANFSALTLQSFYDSAGGEEVVQLQQGRIETEDEFSTSLTLRLADDDLFELQRLYPRICTTSGNCWVKFTSQLVLDVAGNPVVPAVDGVFSESHSAARILQDSSNPEIVNFAINLNADPARVNFTFSEIVTVNTFNPEAITFTNGSVNYTLTGGEVLTTEDAVVSFTFQLEFEDTIALKAIDDFFTGTENSLLTYRADVVEDPFGELAQPRNFSNALSAGDFTQDSLPPSLSGFRLMDLDNDLMQLSFSEPVDRNTLDFPRITLRSGPSSQVSSETVQLTGAISVRYVTEVDVHRRVIEVVFSYSDIRAIKTQPPLATDIDTSYIELQPGAIADTAGVESSATAVALQAQTYVTDSRGPRLLSFVLDLTRNALSLTFDDIIDIDTVDVGEITLQPDQNGESSEIYTLTDSEVVGSSHFNFTISLSETDTNEINSLPNLATGRGNTFISLTGAALDGINGVDVLSIVRSNALNASDFTPDTIPPSLEEFYIDFNSEMLTLVFDETVDVSTFDATQFTLQNSASNPTRSVTLSGGIVTSMRYVTSFQVEFLRSDLNMIKTYTDFAVDNTSTYLLLTDATIRDSRGNPIVP